MIAHGGSLSGLGCLLGWTHFLIVNVAELFTFLLLPFKPFTFYPLTALPTALLTAVLGKSLDCVITFYLSLELHSVLGISLAGSFCSRSVDRFALVLYMSFSKY
jgi:hypothetical protein